VKSKLKNSYHELNILNQENTAQCAQNGFIDASLLCQFATWRFRYHFRQFATWTLRYLDGSPPGRFTPLDVSIPERFANSLDVSPPVRRFVICNTVRTSLSSGSETSREVDCYRNVQRGGTSRWRTSKVA